MGFSYFNLFLLLLGGHRGVIMGFTWCIFHRRKLKEQKVIMVYERERVPQSEKQKHKCTAN